jgi:hypothetical protein
MSIKTEIVRITTNVSNAYDAAEQNGATMPDVKNSANLASTIATITGGEYDIQQTFVDGGTELHIFKAGGGEKLYYCEAIDYDGTILKSGWYSEGQEFELPEFPNHDNLIAQEWTATAPIVNNKIVVTSDIDAGIVYATKSGLTEFDIVLNSTTGLTVTLNINGVKNWGDGTTDTTNSHTYSTQGRYTITCDATEIISNKSQNSYISIFESYAEEGNISCVAIRLGSNVTRFGDMAWATSVEYITIPKSVTILKGNASTDVLCDSYLKTFVCHGGITQMTGIIRTYNVVLGYGLTACSRINVYGHINVPNTIQNLPQLSYLNATNIIIPGSVSSVGTLKNVSCDKLEFKEGVVSIGAMSNSGIKKIVYPNSVVSIGGITDVDVTELILPQNLTTMGVIKSCSYLQKLDIPDSITTLPNSFIGGCPSLKEIIFPKNITTIPGSVYLTQTTLNFSKCVNVVTGNVTIDCLSADIIVPDALYDQWIVSGTWSKYANQIKKASEV